MRAGGAREAEEIADNSEENAAVLENWKKTERLTKLLIILLEKLEK